MCSVRRSAEEREEQTAEIKALGSQLQKFCVNFTKLSWRIGEIRHNLATNCARSSLTIGSLPSRIVDQAYLPLGKNAIDKESLD